MTFTVWDFVRWNRDYFIALSKWEVDECEFAEDWFEVLHSDFWMCFYGKEFWDYLPENFLEYASSWKDCFRYWEEIEVSDTWVVRYKEIFLAKRESKHKWEYLCTAIRLWKKFDSSEWWQVKFWRYARNIRKTLTRKEIAKKFWVSEDFVSDLVDKELKNRKE